MPSDSEEQALFTSGTFSYFLGVCCGVVLGLAVGYLMAYSAGLKFAAKAILAYTDNMPPECQAQLGLNYTHSGPFYSPTQISMNSTGGLQWQTT
jgi:hypothetical protein